eukprot:9881033-Karenia_brevis.AAC.1
MISVNIDDAVAEATSELTCKDRCAESPLYHCSVQRWVDVVPKPGAWQGVKPLTDIVGALSLIHI